MIEKIADAFRRRLDVTNGRVDVTKFLAEAERCVSGKERKALRRRIAAAYAAYAAMEWFCGIRPQHAVHIAERGGP